MEFQKASVHLALIERALKTLPSGGERSSLGTAEPDLAAEPGWFRVRGRLDAWRCELLAQAQLELGTGPHAIAYDVYEVHVSDDQARVRVSPAAPQQQLAVTAPSASLRQSLAGVSTILQEHQDNPQLRQFMQSQLARIQPDSDLSATVPTWPTLRPAQQRAVAACASPGLQLIWGPPGTGKTHVIAAAISHLVSAGHRILLLSANNIAVDNALEQALRSAAFRDPASSAGRAIRVGNIHLASIANNPGVNLPQVVAGRQREDQQRVDHLAAQLADLIGQEQAVLGFDAQAYRSAEQRVSRSQRQAAIAAEQASVAAQIAPLLVQVQRLSRDQLLVDCEATRELNQQIATNIRQVDQALAAHARASPWTRLRRMGRNRRLAEQRGELLAEQASAGRAQRAAEQAATAAGLDPLLAQAPDPACTRAELTAAQSSLDSANSQLQALGLESDALIRAGLGTATDQVLILDQLAVWQQYLGLQGRNLAAEQATLRGKIEPWERELSKGRPRIEQELINNAQLVATTLSQIALRGSLSKKPYDYVIIDEAATASIPFLLAGVALATRGAVLVGDYLQNSPIVEKKFTAVAELKAYFEQDCFSYFAVTDPAAAQGRAGCVVLTEQFRFGNSLTELANRVAYQGVLSCAGNSEGEIVVITVDGLSQDLSRIRRAGKMSGWWVIGTLLARALAENSAEGDFGVVTPYTAQVMATQEALDDSATSRGTAVGTAHAFQGRQFATVLADLVEDGQGWVAKAQLSTDPFKLAGLRLFNVAATRAQRRLYLLTTQRSLTQASAGPLAELNDMVSQGAARCISAAGLLGLTESAPDYDPDSAEAELISALQHYVRVAKVADEDAAIPEIIDRIDRAQENIWCWSAWVGKSAEGITDALVRARDRGVQVWVMARPAAEVQGSNQHSLARLAEKLPDLKYIRRMHQKIVIVDQQWCFFGSQNVLSHGPTSSTRSRDVMLVLDSRSFANRLLEFELAGELGQARTCPQCGTALTECGLGGSGQQRDWYWYCHRDTRQEPHRLAFARSSKPQRNG